MNGRVPFAPEVQVKQFVAELQGPFCRFRVYRTGDERFYLFAPLDPHGCESEWRFPVLKRDLRDDVRRALAHGWGHA